MFGRNLSRLLGSSCEWWLLPLLLGSWSSLFSILVPGLVRLIDLLVEVVPRRIGASSHQHVLRSAGGFVGAREGPRLTALGSSSLSLEPGSGQLEDHTRWRGSR